MSAELVEPEDTLREWGGFTLGPHTPRVLVAEGRCEARGIPLSDHLNLLCTLESLTSLPRTLGTDG